MTDARGPSSAARTHVVSFSLAVPYDGIPHAGGEYYLRHVRALVADGRRVTIVAPAFPPSIAALADLDPHVEVLLIPIGVRDRRFGVSGRVHKALLVSGYRRRVLRDARVAEAVRAADIVEFQWTEMGSLAPGLRGIARPDTRFVGVAHDVVTQSLERFAEQRNAPVHLNVLRRLRLVLGRRDEPRVLNALDLVITFSEKDQIKLRNAGVRTTVRVVRPSLEPFDQRWMEPRHVVDGRVLMVAAFNRKENVAGLLWFLDEVWPQVVAARPGAQLHVVGAEPTGEMLARADAVPEVTVSGYLSDLVPEYQQAAVAVVPLQVGAGVKFKTVTAMLWAVPVVTTEVGAEGIAPAESFAELFAGVTSDPRVFGDAVVRALGPDGPARQGSAARVYASERFGARAFERLLNGLYDELSDRTATSERTS